MGISLKEELSFLDLVRAERRTSPFSDFGNDKEDEGEGYREFLSNFYEEVATAPATERVAHNVTGQIKDLLEERSLADLEGEDKKQTEALTKSLVDVGDLLDEWALTCKNDYHDRAHNLGVGMIVYCLDHYMRARMGFEPDGVHDMNHLTELIAGFAHDLHHDGTNNSPEGRYIPGRLERASFDAIEPILKKNGVSQKFRSRIKYMIFGTDSALPFQIQQYDLRGKDSGISRASLKEAMANLDEESLHHVMAYWQFLHADSWGGAQAFRLKCADMVLSYGLSENMWTYQTEAFGREFKAHNPSLSPQDAKAAATSQLFVMFNFVGAELATNRKAKERRLVAKFGGMDCDCQTLFGGPLAKIQECCEHQAGPEAVKGFKEQWKARLEACKP